MYEERRYLPSQAAIEAPRGKPQIVGYAAIFNSLSEWLPMKTDGRTFREVIRPGAFAESIRSGADVLARFEHEAILGRTGNGTLKLSEDSRGLRYEIDPPNTQLARDVVELIRRRDVAYSSFAFQVRAGGDSWRRDGSTLLREIRAVQLLDVSAVVKGAYTATDVALRSFDQWRRTGGLRRMKLELSERM